MGYLYVARYLAKGVRTEFTYEEHQEMDLPPISFCLSRTFFSTSFCYKNQSYFREYPCNMTKIHTKMWLDADNRYEPVKDLGNNCHVFGLNKTYSVNPNKKQMVKFFFFAPAPSALILSVRSQEELETVSDFTMITQLNTYTHIRGGHQWNVFIDKTEVYRLPDPYPSQCTDEGNVFSKVNTLGSKQEACALSYMLRECGDVIDRWKRYVKDEILPYNTTKYASRRDCLHKVTNFISWKVAPDCDSRLQCHGVRYDIRTESFPTTNSYTRIDVYFDKPHTTKMSEIPDYRFEDFIGALGGFVGICVGMSIFSILELIWYMFLSLVSKVKFWADT